MATAADVLAIPNLAGWWRGDSSPTTTVGAGIASWTDRSPLGRTASQATLDRRPAYIASPYPGGSWTPTSATQFLESSTPSSGEQTVFTVCTADTLAGTRTLRGSTIDGGMQVRLNAGKPSIVRQRQAELLVSTTAVTVNQPCVVTASSGSAGSAVWLNGTSAGSNTTAPAYVVGGTSMIGARFDNGEHWSGLLFEQITFARVLTAAERATVHSYLQDTRPGITTSDYVASGDTTAPTVPAEVTATANTASQVTVGWTGSTDTVGVTSYRVRRGGTDLTGATALGSGVRSFIDTTAVAGTAYSYTVSAVDAAGNRSAESTPATVTTPPAPDTTPPTVPTGVIASPTSGTRVDVSWTASTDAGGVTSYRVRRNGVDLAGSTAVTGLAIVDTTTVAGTAYSYTVSAVDAAGNRSAESAAANVTTPTTLGKLVHRWTGTALVLQKLERWSGTGLVTRIIEGAGSVVTPPVTTPTPTTFPQSFGTLTARPSWTNAQAAAGPSDIPAVSTRTRTLTLPNMPAEGGDILAAWTAYFGDRVGGMGTKQSGDRVIIPGGLYRYSGNLDIPNHGSDIEVVLGTEGNPTTLRSSQITSGLVTGHAIRVLGAANIRIRGVSATTPATIETASVVGRTGLNQQGNTMLLLDPGTSGFYGQDLILRGARAAGFFAYNADHYWLNRVTVEESLADAFHNTQGSSYGIFTDCVSRRPGDDGMAFVYYDGGALTGQSHHMEVYRHVIDTNGHGRGFANICCTDIYADQVIIRGSAASSVIIDREAVSGGTAHGSIQRTLLKRFRIEGGNWSEQDHGSVFLRNGYTNGTVDTVVLESFEIRDAAPNHQVVRAIGDGTANPILECTLTDFRLSGTTTVVANDQFGGNSLTRITRNGWANINPTTTEAVDPTLVINTPGRYATVSGTMTGSTTDTSSMRNTQAIQFYAGDAGQKVSGTNATGVDNVQVKVGSTVIGTVAGTALDTAKRGSQVWDTTAFTNGPARITLTATDRVGRVKVLTRDVVIDNATPGSTSGMPAGTGSATVLPNASNTGPRVARTTSSLTELSGTGTISAQRFTSYVQVYGSPQIVDCEFAGGILFTNQADGASLNYCDVTSGISYSSSKNITVENTDVHGGDDLIHVSADNPVGTRPVNLVLRNVYAHDPTPQAGAHADGIQITGVNGLLMDNCVIDMGPWKLGPDGADALNAAFFTQTSQGLIGDVRIVGGYYNGGGIVFRYEGAFTGVFEVTGITIGPDGYYADQYSPPMGKGPTTQSGNQKRSANGTLTPITFLSN